MAADAAIKVRDLRKEYRIVSAPVSDDADSRSRPLRSRGHYTRKSRETFAALRGMTFDVTEGEVLGIIGRNGAGKSTLLKVLSRITNPTTGRVELYGRVGSLLEVGTGFHGDLTGRENIYLNGAILGMKRHEIDARFDSIVDFAETSTFLDVPVKRYSSGMYVRLAFAVAAHLEPEILIVDEVLAVGDAAFQKKCLGLMQAASAKEGRTVLFVSHNMTAVESICSRGMVIEAGDIEFDGDVRDAIDHYLLNVVAADEIAEGEFDLENAERGSESVQPVFRKLTFRDGLGQVTGSVRMGDDLTVVLDVDGESVRNRWINVRILTDSDRPVASLHSHMKMLELYEEKHPWDQIALTIPKLPLIAGRYWIELAVRDGTKVVGRKTTLDRIGRAASFEVRPADVYGSGFRLGTGTEAGVVFLDQFWEISSNGLRVAATAQ